MKKWLIILAVVGVLAGVIVYARGAMLVPIGAATPTAATASPAHYPPPPGVGIAETLSTITGVAISPLLGVSAVGCYQYCKAQTNAERAHLPWFASPLFWGPAFTLLAACFLKDTAGTALPLPLKKPLDAVETVEHKISGLVATGAFVPIMVAMIHEANSTGGQPTVSLSSLGLAAFTMPDWLYNVLVTPVAMIVFLVVFLASNAINILILLSPFPLIDAGLKTFRTTILASVAGTSLASSWAGHPWLGAVWALVIVAISYFIAGWSFRLSHLGVVFIWDYFTVGRKRFIPDQKENRMFLGRKIDRVPARTFGRLRQAEGGGLEFRYRPFLVLPERKLNLPAGEYEVGRGFFYCEIRRLEGDSARTMLLLPPHYNGHEVAVTSIYGFKGVRDVGIRAAWNWFKGLFSASPKTA